jgi:riboflavin biosynthesis pyrimidine reductase
MSTVASLVVGADGATTLGGLSRGVSTSVDRKAFIERRKTFDVIIIGGNTARTEPYTSTPVPLVILSRSNVNPVPLNPKAQIWNLEPSQAIQRASREFGSNILIEAGADLITKLLNEKLIDEFFLTITPVLGGENIINWHEILDQFEFVKQSELEETVFYHAFR